MALRRAHHHVLEVITAHATTENENRYFNGLLSLVQEGDAHRAHGTEPVCGFHHQQVVARRIAPGADVAGRILARNPSPA